MKSNLPQSELQRFIKPSEIGRLAAFVCSPYASALEALHPDGRGHGSHHILKLFRIQDMVP